MKSLRVRLLLAFLLVSLLTIVFLAAVTTYGIARSRWEWRNMVKDQTLEKLARVVGTLYWEYGAVDTASAREIFNQVTIFAEEVALFAIYDMQEKPLYYWRNRMYTGIKPSYRLKPERAVMMGEDVIGYVAAEPADFYFVQANRGLVNRLIQILLAGLILTVTAAVLLSHRFSRTAIQDARILASLLERISGGERGLLFPSLASLELQTIARAAKQLQEMLIKEENQRRQWTQDIAHDLKTPVTAIKGQIEAIKDGVLELTPQRYQNLEKEFEQIAKLVRDLSLLSEVESHDPLPERGIMEAQGFLDQLKNRFEAIAESQKITIRFNALKNFDFDADPKLLHRAMNNLLQNALRYTPSQGKILLEIRLKEGQVVFKVENSGRIPEKDLLHIFERLYRGDAGRSSPGSGLGLTITQAIVRKHGGEIQAKNTDRGTVSFIIKLPQRGPTLL